MYFFLKDKKEKKKNLKCKYILSEIETRRVDPPPLIADISVKNSIFFYVLPDFHNTVYKTIN